MEPPNKRPRLLAPADGFSRPPPSRKPSSTAGSARVAPKFVSGFDTPPRKKPSSSHSRPLVLPHPDFSTPRKGTSLLDPQLAKAREAPETTPGKPLKVLAPPPIPPVHPLPGSNAPGVSLKSKPKAVILRTRPTLHQDTNDSISLPRRQLFPPPLPQASSTANLKPLPILHPLPPPSPNSTSSGPMHTISTTSYAKATSLLSSQGPAGLASIILQDHPDAFGELQKPYSELDRGVEISPKKRSRTSIGGIGKGNKLVRDGLASQAATFFTKQASHLSLWTRETQLALSSSSSTSSTVPPAIRLRIIKVLHLPKPHNQTTSPRRKARPKNDPAGDQRQFGTPGVVLCRVLATPPKQQPQFRMGSELTLFLQFSSSSPSMDKIRDINTFARIHLEIQHEEEQKDKEKDKFFALVNESSRKKDREIQVWSPWSLGNGNTLFCTRFAVL